MTKLTLFFESYIPEKVLDSSGRDITFKKGDKSCLPLISSCPGAFASYETDSAITSRLSTIISITFNKTKVTEIMFVNQCGSTTQHPGYLSVSQKVETKRAEPLLHASYQLEKDGIKIHFCSEGANPFFNYWGVDTAPSISTEFKLKINRLNSASEHFDAFSIKSVGHVTLFPAHRITYCIDNSVPGVLFDKKPSPGKTPVDLFWGKAQTVKLDVAVSQGLPQSRL